MRSLLQNDTAIVTSWFRIGQAGFMTVFIFGILGYFMDFVYVFAHTNSSWYSVNVLNTIDNIYYWFGNIPIIVLLLVIVFTINYAVWSRND